MSGKTHAEVTWGGGGGECSSAHPGPWDGVSAKIKVIHRRVFLGSSQSSNGSSHFSHAQRNPHGCHDGSGAQRGHLYVCCTRMSAGDSVLDTEARAALQHLTNQETASPPTPGGPAAASRLEGSPGQV